MKISSLMLSLFSVLMVGVAVAEPAAYTLPRSQVIPMPDSATGKQYELYIKLPENYAADQSTRYPVIYYTDAVWHIEALSATTAFLMEDVILVGISWQLDADEVLLKEVGPYLSRFSDYSIRESKDADKQAKYRFGQAENHLAFIRNDVIPYVEKNHRTQPDQRSYFGYSLSGLFGAYVLASQPDTFKHYILGSPSLQRDNEVLAKLQPKPSSMTQEQWPRVYISYGTLEQDRGVPVDAFVAMIKARYDQQLTIKTAVIDGNHTTAFPLTAVDAVKWLAQFNPTGGQP